MDCISFVGNDEEDGLRLALSAPAENKEQDLYVSAELSRNIEILLFILGRSTQC